MFAVLGQCCRNCIQLLTLLTSLGADSSGDGEARRETVSIRKVYRDTAHTFTPDPLQHGFLVGSLRVL